MSRTFQVNVGLMTLVAAFGTANSFAGKIRADVFGEKDFVVVRARALSLSLVPRSFSRTQTARRVTNTSSPRLGSIQCMRSIHILRSGVGNQSPLRLREVE